MVCLGRSLVIEQCSSTSVNSSGRKGLPLNIWGCAVQLQLVHFIKTSIKRMFSKVNRCAGNLTINHY